MPDLDLNSTFRPRARPAPPGAPPPCGPRARAAPAALALALALALACGAGAHAAPEGGKVRQGDADIDRDDDASTTTITQRSRSAVIDWRSFDVAKDETVNFAQPDATSLTVNAIHDVRPTEVLGRISANGRVALLNPHGVIFGRHSVIDVGALIAGSAKFERIDERGRIYTSVGEASSVLINGGLIQASQSVALVGTHLENSGTILARLGSVQLASGRMRTIDFDGYGLIHLGLAPAIEGSLDLSGASRVEANTIAISVIQASRIIDSLVNVDGVLRADTVGLRDGRIALLASNQGVGFSAAADAGERGAIDILSDGAITVAAAAEISAPAGRVRIGGSYQGRDRALLHSASTTVRRGARIDVSAAGEAGAGGEAVVWSDGATDFHGHIRAMGEGGSIEVSGKELGIGEAARFDLSPSGSLLLDPDNVVIGTGGAACTGTGGSTIPTDTADCTIAPSVLEAVGSGTVTVLADDRIDVSGAVSMNPAASLTLRTDGTEITDHIVVVADINGGQTLTIETGGTISGVANLTADTIILSAANAIRGFRTSRSLRDFALNADDITLTAGSIGGGDFDPVRLNAGNSLSLRTSGAGSAGNINVALLDIPTSISTPMTNTGSGQTIRILRAISGDVDTAGLVGAYPSVTVQSGDTLVLGYDVTGDVDIDADISLSSGDAPVLLNATGSITGSAVVSARNLWLQSGSRIGISSVRSLTVNAASVLRLETIGFTVLSGNIYIRATVLPEMELSFNTGNNPQAIRLDFDVAGDVTTPTTLSYGIRNPIYGAVLGHSVHISIATTASGSMGGDITVGTAVNLEPTGIPRSSLTLNAAGSISGSGALTADTITLTAGESISGSGALTADTITLTSADTIGASATSRLAVNAASDLTLKTTGAGGNIFIDATALPSAALTISTDTSSAQTVDLDFDIVGDIDNVSPTTLSVGGGDTLSLDIAATASGTMDGDITVGAALNLEPMAATASTLTLSAAGSISGSGALTADDISLTASRIGSSTAPLRLDVSDSIGLRTTGTGSGGNIYINNFSLIPTTALSVSTDASSAQTVDLNFLISGDVATPAMLSVGGGDTVNLTIATTASGTMDGDITVGTALNFEPAAGITSALTLNAAGSISGSGALTADTIVLTAASSIGTSASSRLAVNASSSLSLTTGGSAHEGRIYIDAAVLPATALTVITDASSVQPVDLDFDISGDVAAPAMLSVGGGDTVSLTIATTASGTMDGDITVGTALNFEPAAGITSALTLSAAGTISGSGALAADDISLTASGIGSTTAPLRLDADDSLRLETSGTGSGGDIYLTLLGIPTSIGAPETDTVSGQDIQILRVISGGVDTAGLGGAFPSVTAQPGDSLVLGYEVTGNVGIDADIALSSGAAPVLLRATGSITGSAAVSASNLRLEAASIGASASSRLAANAASSLSLATTGAGGNIYIGSTVLPATALAVSTDASSAQTVDLGFDIAGDAAIPTALTVGAGDTVILDIAATARGGMDGDIAVGAAVDLGGAATSALTLSAAGLVSGSGTLKADSITLTAAGAIGASASSRLAANAASSLSLATTGAGGNIFIDATALPSAALTISTDASSVQTVDLDFDIVGDIDNVSATTLSVGGGDTLSLNIAATASGTMDGDIAVGAGVDLESTDATVSALTLNAAGSISGPGTLTADSITLTAGGAIGASPGSRLAANAASALSLTTDGLNNDGNIYIGAAVLPATALTISTRGSTQSVDLDFDIVGDAATPATLSVGFNDNVRLHIAATAGDGMDGDITVGAAVNLEPTDATRPWARPSGTAVLNTAGSISGSGTLTAGDITLTASGIGSSTAPLRLDSVDNPDSDDNLSLETSGTGSDGDIYLSLLNFPASINTPVTDAGSGQTIQILRAISGDVNVAGLGDPVPRAGVQSGDSLLLGYDVAGNIDIDADISLGTGNAPVLLRATGSITGSGAVSASNLRLEAASIGASASSRLAVNARLALSLATNGAGGNIYIGSTVLPATALAVGTDASSAQAVDLDFDIVGDAAIPAMLTVGAGDTVKLDITATAGGDITAGAAVNLEPSAATASALTLNAAGVIVSSGALTADDITLKAVGVIGASAAGRLTANASNSLNLETTGSGGHIFLGGSWPLSLTMATGAGAQRVDLSFIRSGSLAMMDIAPHSGDTLSLSLTITGADAGIDAGTIIADTISLTAAGAIGAAATSRLTANASSTLSLATTGSGGNIFIGATAMPAATLSVSTDASSAQTVDLDFDVVGDVRTPRALSVAGGDTVSLDIAAAAGANDYSLIEVFGAINLEPTAATVSTLTLNAAGSISGSGALTADTITLTAVGGRISNTAALTADDITLTAAGAIGLSTPDIRNGLRLDVSDSLSLRNSNNSNRAEAHIHLFLLRFPTSIDTVTDADSTQRIQIIRKISGDVNTAGLGVFPSVTVQSDDRLVLEYDVTGNIEIDSDLALGSNVRSLILRASGSITGSAAISARELSMSAASFGVSATNRLTVNADHRLSLSSFSSSLGGNIFIGATVLPVFRLGVGTDPSTAQTIDLDFDIAGGATSSFFDVGDHDDGAVDTVRIDIAATASGEMQGDIRVGDVNIRGAATSAVTLNAAGNIFNSGTLVANNITLAASRIVSINSGLVADNITLAASGIGSWRYPVRLDAAGSLSLQTSGTGNAGDIYVSLGRIPASISAPVTDTGSGQAIQILRAINGDVDTVGLVAAFPSLTALGAMLSPVVPSDDSLILGYDVTGNVDIDADITLSSGEAAMMLRASGSITGSAAVSASNLRLQAASIGTSATSRLAANGTSSLRLETFGRGNIYIGATVLPATALTISIRSFPRTVNLGFDIVGDVVTPATFSIAAGDAVTLDIATTAGGGMDGDITAGADVNLGGAATSALTLSAAGSITGPGALAADAIALAAGESISGSGALTADSITLASTNAIGVSATSRLAVEAASSLSLETTGSGGHIFILATALPAMALTTSTDASSAQTVDLDFGIAGDAATPATLSVGGGDAVTLAIAAAAGGGTDGDITVLGAINLEPTAATASALTLSAAGSITGPGALAADAIALAAGGTIGASAASRLAASAASSLSLETTGSGGHIFILATALPAMALTTSTDASSAQTVDLDFSIAGDAATPATLSVGGGDAVTLAIAAAAGGGAAGDIAAGAAVNLGGAATSALTLSAAGSITGPGALAADAIALAAGGTIGASAASRLAASAASSLSLETTGSGGHIFILATALPAMALTTSTDASSAQTVDLDFSIAGDAATPAALTVAAGDAVTLAIAAAAGGGTDGDITVLGAINLEPTAAATSALTLSAAGSITGPGALAADAIALAAGGTIGASAASRLAASAASSLSLETTGSGGHIFILATALPAMALTTSTDASSAQTVDLDFSIAGDAATPAALTVAAGDAVTLAIAAAAGGGTDGDITVLGAINLEPTAAATSALALSAAGSITGPGALAADAIALAAGGTIGASAASRLAASAASSLSLETTGSGGHIFILATALPAMALTTSTDASSAQTVDLDFSIAGDAATPAALTVAAGDAVTLAIAAAAGGGAAGDIAAGAAVNLGGAATSALALSAAGSITGPGALAADAIALAAGGTIGASAASRLAASAASSLSLETTGSGGHIFILATALPAMALTTSTDASSAQTVDLDFSIAGDAATPAALTVAAGDAVTLAIAAAAGGGAAGDIAAGAAVNLGGAATSALALSAAGSITGPGALAADAIALAAGGTIGASAASRLAASAASSLSLETTGSGGHIFILATALPAMALTTSTDASSAQTVDLDFSIAGDAATPAALTVAAGDAVTLAIAAAAGGGAAGDITVFGSVDLGGAATSALALDAVGAISGSGVLTADAINIEARRVGLGSDAEIGATLEGDSDVARLRVAARTLNINSGAVEAGGAGGASPAEHIYISLQRDLASGTLAASGRLSIDPNGHSVGAVRQSDGSDPVPGNPLGFSDGGPGVNEAVESALDASQGDLVDFRARRLYIGAPTGSPAPAGGTRISTDSIRLDIDPLDEGAPLPSVSMRYRPAAGAEAVLRLEYVNSVRDFVLSAERGAAPSRLVVGEVGLYGDSGLRGGIQDAALHNFASFHNGYGVQEGGSATLLASDDATLDGIGRYQVAPNQAAVANFNVRQLFLYAAPARRTATAPSAPRTRPSSSTAARAPRSRSSAATPAPSSWRAPATPRSPGRPSPATPARWRVCATRASPCP